MPKVTSKLQLTVPKAVADQYRTRPGDELEWIPAGDTIRVVLVGKNARGRRELTSDERLKLFDQATERQRQREASSRRRVKPSRSSAERGWKREDVYTRGFSG